MKWSRLADEWPDPKKANLVLGYQKDLNNADLWHICETSPETMKGKRYLYVFDSICPPLGSGENAHWAYLPEDSSPEWIPFDIENYESDSFYKNELILRMGSGNKYVGHLQQWWWAPSFNLFRYGSLKNITHTMPVPSPPKEKAEVNTIEKQVVDG